MSKVTDLLLDTLRNAEAGDRRDLDANLASSPRGTRTCSRQLLPAETARETSLGKSMRWSTSSRASPTAS